MPVVDFYKILGVEPTATPEEIKNAFRKLALKFHPDRNPDNPACIEIFAAIRKAYEILSNPSTRQEYDRKHHTVLAASPSAQIVKTVIDRTRIGIAVDKRVLKAGETLKLTVSIYEPNSKMSVNGLGRFEIVDGPEINSFPPGRDMPDMEVAYVLKPKDYGYIEVGPASFVANGIRFSSDSIYVKSEPPEEMVHYRPATRLEKTQSAVIGTFIIAYSILIAYNIYMFDIRPFVISGNAPPGGKAVPFSQMFDKVQLETGDVPYGDLLGVSIFDESSYHRILFHNDKRHDAVVFLTDVSTDKPIRNNYIAAGDDYWMRHIPDGSYYLKVLFGNDWNKELKISEGIIGGFSTNARYEVFKQEFNVLQMKRTYSGDTLDYKIFEITLYPVSEGNVKSKEVDAGEFF